MKLVQQCKVIEGDSLLHPIVIKYEENGIVYERFTSAEEVLKVLEKAALTLTINYKVPFEYQQINNFLSAKDSVRDDDADKSATPTPLTLFGMRVKIANWLKPGQWFIRPARSQKGTE